MNDGKAGEDEKASDEDQMPAHTQDMIGIAEAADTLGLEPHILTFWEGLFPRLTPKTENGRRYYGVQDMALLRYIRTSLIDRKLSVTVVRRRLKKWKMPKSALKNLKNGTEKTSVAAARDVRSPSAITAPENTTPDSDGKTARELHSAVRNAAESGVFSPSHASPSHARKAHLKKSLDRIQEIKERLDWILLQSPLRPPP